MKPRKPTRRTNVAITTEGWYYVGMLAFIVAGAMIRDINLLYIMAGMMLGPLFFSWYASMKSLRRIKVTRRFPSLISVADPLFVEVNASKPKGSPKAYATVVQDRICREGSRSRFAIQTELFFPTIRSGNSQDGSYRANIQDRGRYNLGPIKVSTSMPLGLVRVTKTFDEEVFVLVSPKIGSLSPAWSRHLEFKQGGGQKSVRRRGNAEGDFYGMREWRNGDSLNRIHWRTTAKRDKLTVRQFEQRVNQDLVVLLDLWNDAAIQTSDREKQALATKRVEAAISFAATLIVEHCKQGTTHVVFATVGRKGFTLQGVSSPVFQTELMEKLAFVEPCSEDQLPDVLGDVLPLATSHARMVMVSSQHRDLTEPQKFGSISENTSLARGLSEIVHVDSASPQFEEWFQFDQIGTEAPVRSNGRSSVPAGSVRESPDGVSPA